MKTLCSDETRPRGILSSRISRAREQNYSRSSIQSNRSRHRISYQNVVHGAAQKRRKLSASIPMTVAIENRHLRIQAAIVDHDGKSIEASLLPQNFWSGLASLDKRNTGSIDGVNAGIADSWGRLEKGKIVWGTVIGNSRRGTSDMGMLAGKTPWGTFLARLEGQAEAYSLQSHGASSNSSFHK